MRNRLVLIALALSCAAAPVAPLEAQRLVSLNVGGGATLPLGNLADGADPGWHALAGLGIGSLMQPIGIRVEGAYNRFGGDASADPVITSATLNFTYRLPMTNSPVSPYLITGWGAHWLDCSDAACDADQRFGGNAGLGMKFNVGLRGFIESRFHWVTGKVRYVPVTFGIML
jgi:hypothetical protein